MSATLYVRSSMIVFLVIAFKVFVIQFVKLLVCCRVFEVVEHGVKDVSVHILEVHTFNYVVDVVRKFFIPRRHSCQSFWVWGFGKRASRSHQRR